MNRPEKRISDAEAKAVLRAGTYGVLSVVGEDGAPYGVPLNYVYSEEERALFFHCAQAGRKLDAIRRESRVSFAVVGKAEIDAPQLTSRYESVIAEGRASVVQGDDEKRLRLRQLCDALAPASPRRDAVIEKYLPPWRSSGSISKASAAKRTAAKTEEDG
jgi:nitroimidazol reductase NimA-like FMN-containing flavoprotein (pyridoxamine 5'-phosphate oxidase superfamily)